MKPNDVNVMTNGKRPISAVTVGLLCDLLHLEGMEAQRLAVEAVIDSAKPEKRGVLRRAFFAERVTGEACRERPTEECLTTAHLAASADINFATAHGLWRSEASMGSPPSPRGSQKDSRESEAPRLGSTE